MTLLSQAYSLVDNSDQRIIGAYYVPGSVLSALPELTDLIFITTLEVH